MINATEMAKPFGKLPADWLRYKPANDFLQALSTMRTHIIPDYVQVKSGCYKAKKRSLHFRVDFPGKFYHKLVT